MRPHCIGMVYASVCFFHYSVCNVTFSLDCYPANAYCVPKGKAYRPARNPARKGRLPKGSTMATRTRTTTSSKAATSTNEKPARRPRTTSPAPTVQVAPSPVVAAPAAPSPVVVCSTTHVPARGRSYTYPAARGKVTAAVVLDALLQTGASLADMAAALVQAMPDNYAAVPAKAVAKAKAHLSFLRKHGAVITANAGVFSCPDARNVQTMARGGNRA